MPLETGAPFGPQPPPLEVTEADEPHGEDGPLEPFDPDDEDEIGRPAPSWLGAIGQMAAAVLVVVALVAFFIGVAVAVRRLWP